MVDAPWLSPREYSGAFFLSQGKSKELVILPLLPHLPLSPFPLRVGTTSGKGRLSK